MIEGEGIWRRMQLMQVQLFKEVVNGGLPSRLHPEHAPHIVNCPAVHHVGSELLNMLTSIDGTTRN